jgi:hypothetical protein
VTSFGVIPRHARRIQDGMTDWTDGYVVTLAYQLVRRLDWDRLAAIDGKLSRTDFKIVFDGLRSHGIEVFSDGVDELTYRNDAAQAAVPALLAQLRALVARLRTAGAAAFTDPTDMPERLHCTLNQPREWFGVPEDRLDRVQILNFTDMPADDSCWLARSRVAQCSALRLLKLVSVRLDASSLDIELGHLDELLALNLDANRLTALPPEIADARSLEWLSLNQNPITADSLEPLSGLPRLRYLGLVGTEAKAEVDRVRAIVPRECVIQCLPG